MNLEIKYFIESNYDFLVLLYNRYIRFCLRKTSDIEYYASPYMNLTGYPSDKFLLFCNKYYNRKMQKKKIYFYNKENKIKNFYLYCKLFLLFFISQFFFAKKINKDSIVIHGFHNDEYFKNTPYTTVKSPPLNYFPNKTIYHDINLSFISLKSLLKYKKNNITCSLIYLSVFDFVKIHYLAFCIFIRSYKINLFAISIVDIIYTLVKGMSIAKLINNLDDKTKYLHMWENRGYQQITDYCVIDTSKLFYLDLGVTFRACPQYTMFRYKRHVAGGKFLFMSKYNYDLIKNTLDGIRYDFYLNYRLNCNNFQESPSLTNKILLISPISKDTTDKLYKLILDNKNLDIKIKLHPYVNKKNYDTKYIEYRSIYEILYDYDKIIYAGITTAAVELYFKGKEIYKFTEKDSIDIDFLTDNGFVMVVRNLSEICQYNNTKKTNQEYYLGCKNKKLYELLE